MIDDNSIKELLASLAETGVCQTGKRYLRGTSQDLGILIKVWRRWPEYWFEHSAFAINTLREYVTDDAKKHLAEQYLFMDFVGSADIDIENTDPVFVVGDSEASLSINDYAVVKIYAFNNAKVSIACGNHAVVFIETYDNTQIHIQDNPDAKIIVFQYDCSNVLGRAKIKKKEYHRGEVFNGLETGSSIQ